jgi:ubiquinone/menaquinone biosynthesis C-methylase UbiE
MSQADLNTTSVGAPRAAGKMDLLPELDSIEVSIRPDGGGAALPAQLLEISPFELSADVADATAVPAVGSETTVSLRLGGMMFDVTGRIIAHESAGEGAQIVVRYELPARPMPDAEERLSTRWMANRSLPVVGWFENALRFGERAYFVVEDLSIGGLRVRTRLANSFLVPGSRLTANLTFPFVAELDTLVEIRAVNLHTEADGERWMMAHAEFIGVSDKHIDVVSRYLAEFCPATDLMRLHAEGLLPSRYEDLLQFIEIGDADGVALTEVVGMLLSEPILRFRISDAPSASSAAPSDPAEFQADLYWHHTEFYSDDVGAQLLRYLVVCATNRGASRLAVRFDANPVALIQLGFVQGRDDWYSVELQRALAGRGLGPLVWVRYWYPLRAQLARAGNAALARPRRTIAALRPALQWLARVRDLLRPRAVSWDHYALHYDKMCSINPAYDANVQRFCGWMRSLDAGSVKTIFDLGGGTGNVSQAVAMVLPQATVYHVDQDAAMNLVARRKFAAHGVRNVRILPTRIEDLEIESASADVVVCGHSIYTVADPAAALRRIRQALRPGGHLMIIDVGRTIHIGNWAVYLFRHAWRRLGFFKTVALFIEGRQVARQNQNIAAKQADGVYWMHSTEEFVRTLRDAGFDVLESGVCYRGISDYALCRVPA